MNNLRTYRERKGMTQTELGLKVGLSTVTICHLEKGLKETTGTKWKLLAKALDCTVDELLGGE